MTAKISFDAAGFAWAAGIENTFIPQVRPGLRALDEYDLMQHYRRWQEDFDLIAATGVRFVRWGFPWYRVQPTQNHWDWEWTDRALDYLVNRLGLTPILDLMHYGTPLWMDNSFLNASYPDWVAEYAARGVERYGALLSYYTPLNEPLVNAHMCGRKGQWPPYLEGHDGFVKVLLALARGIVLTTHALRSASTETILVQVEALGKVVARKPDLTEEAKFSNLSQYLSLDLTTGRVDEGHPLWPFLKLHGVTAADLTWFRERGVRYDYLGVNFYPWSFGTLARQPGGLLYRVTRHTTGYHLAEVLTSAYERYQIPVLVTETSAKGEATRRQQWMDETIAVVKDLRRIGVPVVGYTWFPVFSMIDWAYRKGRRPLEYYLLHLGLYEAEFNELGNVEHHATPLVEHYRRCIAAGVPELGG